MKTTIRMSCALCFMAMLHLLSGCATYMKPTAFVHRIKSADRIAVTNSFPEPPAMFEKFGLTNATPPPAIIITGWDVKKITYEISMLREPVDDTGILSSATLYVWHLEFYRGDKLLGTAGVSQDLMEIDDMEYHTPLSLRKLLADYVDKARAD